MATSEDPPDSVTDLADSCVRFISKAVGVDLDFTSDTLPILDHYLSKVKVAGTSGELVELVAPACGAYFGEVVRRRYPDARWHAPGAEYLLWRIEFGNVFLYFNPIGVVMEAIEKAPSAEWNAHFQLLESDRLVAERAFADMKGVQPKDFFRTAVRFDALESLVELLVGLKDARNEGARFFDRAAYERAVNAQPEPRNLLH